jgi:hypothetical protein
VRNKDDQKDKYIQSGHKKGKENKTLLDQRN